MFTFPLSSSFAALETAGGKGANLARLKSFNFPVPDGFIISTEAYRTFVECNHLQGGIKAAVTGLSPDDLPALEAASARIRDAFRRAQTPPDLIRDIQQAYAALDFPQVAVRSSATAEDLPGMSFAGQQDTYLNVSGAEALLQAVVDCWGSLWTARAIGYRIRNGISQSEVALAVVVQRMVQSTASGVLFTANPLTGKRAETVIDAVLGLGEALVSGQVEPDHYVVDAASGRILEKVLGSKTIIGEKATEAPEASRIQALPDGQILVLADLGQQIAARFGEPQDIEWAWADGKLHIVQSRPITTLYPIPEGWGADPLRVFFSFGAVQGVLDPFTPFGQDTLKTAFAGFSRWLGYRRTYQSQSVLNIAGERLWGDFTPVIRNSIGRRVLRAAMGIIEPTAGQALKNIWDDPKLQPERPGVRLKTILRLVRFFLPTAGKVLLNLLNPDGRRLSIHARGNARLAEFASHCSPTGPGRAALRRVLECIDTEINDLVGLIPNYISLLMAGMVSLNLVNRFAAQVDEKTGSESVFTDRTLEITRGQPNNPTTEMDLRLWDTAEAIRRDPESLNVLRSHPVPELAAAYLDNRLPQAAQQAVAEFMEQYGMRGLGEIDLGRPRWREDPTALFQTLVSYLEIEDEEGSPRAVFERGARSAEGAIESLANAVRRTRGGFFKAHLVRWAGRRMRLLLGQREAPKFFIIRLMGVMRRSLLHAGQAFTTDGTFDRPDDIFFLHITDLRDLAAGKPRDYRSIIAQNRLANSRERLRRQIPHLLLSDGRAYYGSLPAASGGNTLQGSPVSPGSVEGRVHVILDPRGARLAPGEILVCPATDPGWTPLFLAAGGLVMEVGGMMTHGAVVAREYGIPAVVGVYKATTLLKTGQRIRVDGSTGLVELIDDHAADK